MPTPFADSRGNHYATEALRDSAEAQHAVDDKKRADSAAQEVEAWEANLRNRYLETPGSSEADWQRDRAEVLSSARKRAALATDDSNRADNARRYA
jgi:hypothetical protein